MADFVGVLRPFLLPGVNSVREPLFSGLQDWVNKAVGYQTITDLSSGSSFVLRVLEPETLISAYAFDIDRLASAAFESLLVINRSVLLPSSTAWAIIQSYYAAYFAAHAILRLFGTSCSHLDGSTVNKVTKLFALYGVDHGFQISSGTYRCCYDDGKKEQKELGKEKLTGELLSSGGGSHEAIWKVFAQLISQLSVNVLTVGVARDNQPVSGKLTELSECLRQGSSQAGWLSEIRNKINYQHSMGCWFPYSNAKRQYASLFGTPKEWLCDPMSIPISPAGATDLVHVQRVCYFIVAFCHALIADLADRCPIGTLFAEGGSLRLLKQTAPRRV